MKKEATPKRQGLKKKTSDEKRGNPKMQRAKKRPPTEKEATPECKGLSVKIFDRKRVSEKACFTELTLEGEGDAFQFKL
jgi:hypothetical protein